MTTGELILVATPIGNLGDLSPRAAEAFQTADAIACEDTRHTRKLLSAQNITGKRLLAVHEHNEEAAAEGIVGLMQRGERIALVTDAGTPGISDPGTRVVQAVIAAGLPVTAVPGPVAFICALIISGLPTERFVFDGFLPNKGTERKQRIAELQTETRTAVLYESPHRIVETLADLARELGGTRLVSVSRELTKKFETTWRGPLAEAAAAMGEPRGEYVVVLHGAERRVEAPVDLESAIREELAQGRSTRDIADALAPLTGRPRKEIYDLAVALKKG